MKIAVYAIALNEAKHVDRWMDSMKGADLVVVADTGSTDGTQDMLRKRGAIVHQISVQPFRFDVARNTALALVPNDVDVCLISDLDEVAEEGFFDKVREQWKPGSNRGWIVLDTGNMWAGDRLHSRHGFVWKYACHEIAVPSMGTQVVPCTIEAVVKHEPDNTKSRGQYLQMLEMAQQEMPEDDRMIVYLAREYHFKQMWEKVIETGLKLDRLNKGWYIERAQTWRGIGHAYCQLGNDEEGLKWLLRGIEEAPEDVEAWFPLAFYYYERQQWQECYDSAMKITVLPLEGRNHYVADSSMPWRMYDLLSIACWNLGKKGSAKKYARMAMELNPDEQRLVDNYQFILTQTAKDYKDGLS